MRRRGGALLETVMFTPVLLALLVGSAALARVTYTYYMLEKVMYNLARTLSSLEGINFCDPTDITLVDATNYAVTGTVDATGTSVVPGLTPAMVQVRPERYDANLKQVILCDCSAIGCDANQGAQPPNYIVVSLTDGYPMNPVFWSSGMASIQLRPSVRVPYAGP